MIISETNIQSQTIHGPQGNIYISEKGSGEIPVVFTHSFGGTNEHWKNQMMVLSKDHKTVAFDFRGHGKSDIPKDMSYSAEELAEDISAVVDSIHLDKFILVGHSMGGSASIAYSGKHPERVAGLFLVGTPGKSSNQQSEKIISSLKSDSYQQVMDQYMMQLLKNSKPSTNQFVNSGIKKITREQSLNIIESMFNFDPLPSLKNYAGPKMIVYTSMENQQGSLSSQRPDIPAKMVDGTSHWIQLDKPEEFNKILSDFIKTVGR